jgi:hypothetical protein
MYPLILYTDDVNIFFFELKVVTLLSIEIKGSSVKCFAWIFLPADSRIYTDDESKRKNNRLYIQKFTVLMHPQIFLSAVRR